MWFESVQIDENVLRFQVAMDNASVVDILDPFQNLPQQVGYNGRFGQLLFFPEGHEIFSGEVLYY
jgi:hypothetical protein